MNQSLPLDERFRATIQLAELPRNSTKVRIRNRCEVSG
ncbi:30S ribosomal protein S14, partial [Escherichia coli]|nr:30S ribosomal protein S14 [Escherichia coli]